MQASILVNLLRRHALHAAIVTTLSEYCRTYHCLVDAPHSRQLHENKHEARNPLHQSSLIAVPNVAPLIVYMGCKLLQPLLIRKIE